MGLGPCGKEVQSTSTAEPSLGWPNKWPQVDALRDLSLKCKTRENSNFLKRVKW